MTRVFSAVWPQVRVWVFSLKPGSRPGQRWDRSPDAWSHLSTSTCTRTTTSCGRWSSDIYKHFIFCVFVQTSNKIMSQQHISTFPLLSRTARLLLRSAAVIRLRPQSCKNFHFYQHQNKTFEPLNKWIFLHHIYFEVYNFTLKVSENTLKCFFY